MASGVNGHQLQVGLTWPAQPRVVRVGSSTVSSLQPPPSDCRGNTLLDRVFRLPQSLSPSHNVDPGTERVPMLEVQMTGISHQNGKHAVNRRFLLRERPQTRIGPDTFTLVEEPVPDIGEGEALVRVGWISADPTNRLWLREAPTYLPPVGIGEVMRAGGLGRVVRSRHPGLAEGQLVSGVLGWQEWTVVSDTTPYLQPVPDIPGVTPSAYLGVLGITG